MMYHISTVDFQQQMAVKSGGIPRLQYIVSKPHILQS